MNGTMFGWDLHNHVIEHFDLDKLASPDEVAGCFDVARRRDCSHCSVSQAGDVSEEVCYWKDMTLVPHLINLLSKRAIHASVRFTELRQGSMNHKELTRQLHSEVLRLTQSGCRCLN